jgi:hypothetical protein
VSPRLRPIGPWPRGLKTLSPRFTPATLGSNSDRLPGGQGGMRHARQPIRSKRAYRAPAGLVWRAASCACVLLSVGNLRRTSHAARMHATHARPPYSEDYRANILISLQDVRCIGVVSML